MWSCRVSTTRPTLRRRAVSLADLGLFQTSRLEAVQRVEAALDEPRLVVAAVARPRAAQHQQLDLARRVAGGLQRPQAGGGLGERVEGVALGPLRARLVVEVALGHARVGGAEDAAAGAGVGLGQHGDDGHAGLAAHRLHLQVGAQVGVEGQPPGGAEALVGVEHLALGQPRQAAPGVAADGGVVALAGQRVQGGQFVDEFDEQFLAAGQVNRLVAGQPFGFASVA